MTDITLTMTVPSSGLSQTNLDQQKTGSSPERSQQQEDQMLEALAVLLNALMPNNTQGNNNSQQGDDPLNRSADSLGNNTDKQALSESLMKLLEQLLPGDDAKNGQNAQNPLSQSNNATPGSSPLSGTSGSGDTQNPENLSRSLLDDTSSGAMKNAINPTEDGGGQISENTLIKLLMELIANLMDTQKDEFGQPEDSKSTPASNASNPMSTSNPNSSSSPAGNPPSTTSGSGNPTTPSTEGSKGAAPSGSGSTNNTSQAGPVEFPSASGDVTTVDETIKVGPGEVFDGGGKTFVASDKLGDGTQKEGQKPIFELADGATLKNVVFGDNAADGVHVKGDAKIDNVHWTNVGEDALTVKSNNGKPANVEITNSSAQGASDKIFQLNADANLTIDNFKAKDFGTFIRTNGGQQGDWNINLSNIDAENGKFSFVKSDSDNLNVTGGNINLTNVDNHYKVPQSANIQVN
ncbi:pectate lyase [Brenneria alni]|uniref:pectate lyase n=1 Tax=Brenneria alni TaxID=71656 RepID=A0A421DQ73_9GAMM|nr:pectate lyase [Brenneria alni]RLM25294.1 pectate lyase [Brenneria alni]